MRSTRGETTRIALAALLIALALHVPVRADDPPCHSMEGMGGDEAADDGGTQLKTSVERYDVPAILLTDQDGAKVDLSTLGTAHPVAVNFIFTTCTTICPVMSASFQRLERALGDDIGDLEMVSISIDPEYDTPEVLREYADRFGAGEHWSFLTGDADDVTTVLRAFNALSGSKMNHKPFTLFKVPGDEGWTRVEGLAGANALADEYRHLVSR